MKNVIQSVIDKEKDCTERLEKSGKDARAAILLADKRSKDLVDNVRSEVSRAAAEMIATAEAQADQAQKEVLAEASTNYAAIDEEKQALLSRKALTTLLGN